MTISSPKTFLDFGQNLIAGDGLNSTGTQFCKAPLSNSAPCTVNFSIRRIQGAKQRIYDNSPFFHGQSGGFMNYFFGSTHKLLSP